MKHLAFNLLNKSFAINQLVVLILIFFASNSLSASAQVHTIDWQATKAHTTTPRPTFTDAFHAESYHSFPVWRTQRAGHWAASVINPVYTPVSNEVAYALNHVVITSSAEVQTHTATGREQDLTIVSVFPFRRDIQTGQYQKLSSFELSWKPEKSQSVFATTATQIYTDQSVLATGNWYKLAVTESGMYRLTYNSLQEMGIQVSNINPANIKIYGNGGHMLPEPVATERPDDLVENAIMVQGQQDGSFDSQDAIIFYGQGPHKMAYDISRNMFTGLMNIYSDTTYYFLTISNEPGLRVSDTPLVSDAGANVVTSYDYYQHHEEDEANILKSGRRWLGERFENTSKEYDYNIVGVEPNATMKIVIDVASTLSRASGISSSFRLSMNNSPENAIVIPAHVDPGSYGQRISYKNFAMNYNTGSSPASSYTIKLTYDKNGSQQAIGYLDRFSINVSRRLKLYGGQTAFRSAATLGAVKNKYVLEQTAASSQIWNVTNPLQPSRQLFNQQGSNLSFVEIDTSGLLQEYVVFDASALLAPQFKGKVVNQNLHGITVPGMLIIAAPEFIEEAQRLANFRQSNNNLPTTVVTPRQIYNEFSSGSQDLVAIRDFVRMLHKKDSSDQFKFVLLFGDCSVDYKNRLPNNTNFVPTYESHVSNHDINSYCSDDFIGLVADDAGKWVNTSVKELLFVGIGRLPVKNKSEAAGMVDKLIRYSQNQNAYGRWRNTICMVGDDADGEGGFFFIGPSAGTEGVIKGLTPTHRAAINFEKIYVDAYEQQSTAGGEIVPDAINDLNDVVKRGAVIVNFMGHGNTEAWTSEKVLGSTQLNKWRNEYKLPFFITATCDYGLYDNPGLVSSGEETVLLSDRGGIGLITAARPVYASTNFTLNKAFYVAMSGMLGNQDEILYTGEIFRRTKNSSISGISNRSFTLLGDPSTVLAIPRKKVNIVSVLDKNTQLSIDTLSALSPLEIRGEITDALDNRLTDFTGRVEVVFYDKAKTLTTLGAGNNSPMDYELQTDILYSGTATAQNGEFSLSLVVPKDVSLSVGEGKIYAYAVNQDYNIDASGHKEVILGGINPNAKPDDKSPYVELYVNGSDENNVFSCTEPVVTAFITDENGINLSETGIGRGLSATLQGPEGTQQLSMKDFYVSKINDYTEGNLTYPFSELPEGNYTLTLTAWDTYNNPTDATVQFEVAGSNGLQIRNTRSYPNPMTEYTNFVFEHTACQATALDVIVKIYSLTGQLVTELTTNLNEVQGYENDHLRWEGQNQNGARVSPGMYIYQLSVKQPNGRTETQTGKLLLYK